MTYQPCQAAVKDSTEENTPVVTLTLQILYTLIHFVLISNSFITQLYGIVLVVSLQITLFHPVHYSFLTVP